MINTTHSQGAKAFLAGGGGTPWTPSPASGGKRLPEQRLMTPETQTLLVQQ